jgi:hypothetical protein
VQPEHDSDIDITLLSGSGISGGIMTANFKCQFFVGGGGGNKESRDGRSCWWRLDAGSNCRSRLSATSTAQDFIWAAGPGSDIASNDPAQTITQHSDHGNFRLNLVRATGGDTTNPFLAANGATPTGGVTNNNQNTGNTGGSSVAAPQTKADKVLIAHGMLLAISSYMFFQL